MPPHLPTFNVRFKAQAALKDENSKKTKDWVKISNSEKDVQMENLDNQKRFIRSLSRTLRYHQVTSHCIDYCRLISEKPEKDVELFRINLCSLFFILCYK